MNMKMMAVVVLILAVVVVSLAGVAGRSDAADKSGETLFREFCAVCHVDGGNIVNPAKTLHKKDLEANNMASTEAIVKNMRNPGPGMTKFSEKIIPDKDAKKIAEYIMKTFGK